MVKSKSTTIEDYEKKEPPWWLNRHKSDLSHLCIRVDQLLKAMEEDDIDRIEVYSGLIRKLLSSFNDSGIGLYHDFEEE